jgi:hypothetical protein
VKIFRVTGAYRSIYEPSIVADGNFKLENVVTKKPEEDVYLSDGRGYMVEDAVYQEHIKASIEIKQVQIPCIISSMVIDNSLSEV